VPLDREAPALGWVPSVLSHKCVQKAARNITNELA